MGHGREKETSINDKWAGYHGNCHTTNLNYTAQTERSSREEEVAVENMGTNKREAEVLEEANIILKYQISLPSSNLGCFHHGCWIFWTQVR